MVLKTIVPSSPSVKAMLLVETLAMALTLALPLQAVLVQERLPQPALPQALVTLVPEMLVQEMLVQEMLVQEMPVPETQEAEVAATDRVPRRVPAMPEPPQVTKLVKDPTLVAFKHLRL